MFWVKPTDPDFGNSIQYAFIIDQSIQCYFSAGYKLICESFEKCEKMIVDSSALVVNKWAHISIGGLADVSSYLSLDFDDAQVAQHD